MKKNNLKPIVAAIGSTIALAIAAPVTAGDNPFQMSSSATALLSPATPWTCRVTR